MEIQIAKDWEKWFFARCDSPKIFELPQVLSPNRGGIDISNVVFPYYTTLMAMKLMQFSLLSLCHNHFTKSAW